MMSFLGTFINWSHTNKKRFYKISLQALVSRIKAYTDNSIYINKCLRRMSFALSFKTSGGISVEAAIAVPIFIFFITNLLLFSKF